MSDALDPAAVAAITRQIVAKRDALLAERRALVERRAEILTQIRRNEREFADCRAAARLFDIPVDFPSEEVAEGRVVRSSEEAEYRTAVSRAIRAEAEALQRPLFAGVSDPHKSSTAVITRAAPPPMQHIVKASDLPPALPVIPAPSSPAVRELALAYLQKAGAAGAKAAAIREHYERTYNRMLHEKTVGMTLYRLSKDGLVRRVGQTWFFVEPSKSDGDIKNPGVSPPGSET